MIRILWQLTTYNQDQILMITTMLYATILLLLSSTNIGFLFLQRMFRTIPIDSGTGFQTTNIHYDMLLQSLRTWTVTGRPTILNLDFVQAFLKFLHSYFFIWIWILKNRWKFENLNFFSKKNFSPDFFCMMMLKIYVIGTGIISFVFCVQHQNWSIHSPY